MSDVTRTTLDVVVNDDRYVFRIPSIADEIKLGLRERQIRLQFEAEMGVPATGMPTGDVNTEFLVRTIAYVQQLLVGGPRWIWTPDEENKPTVDFTLWGDERLDTLFQVGMGFEAELRRFRNERDRPGEPAGGEAVAGRPNPGNEPIPPGPPQS